MGIERFHQVFEQYPVIQVDRSCKHAMIDGNLYWITRQDMGAARQDSGVVGDVINDISAFTQDYVRFVFTELLQFEVQQHDEKRFIQQLQSITLWFDNDVARSWMKIPCCLNRQQAQINRMAASNKPPLLQLSRQHLDYFIAEFCAQGAELLPLVDVQVVLKNIKFAEARYDTDDEIVLFCYKQLNSPGDVVQRNRSFVVKRLNIDDIPHVMTGGSDLAIFSGDSDFLSYFWSFSKHAGIFHYSRILNHHQPVILLMNAHLNESHPIVIFLTKCATRFSKEYKNLSFDYVFSLGLKFAAMLSHNDYITASVAFYSERLIEQAFETVFLMYKNHLGRNLLVSKSSKRPFSKQSSTIKYLDDNDDSKEGNDDNTGGKRIKLDDDESKRSSDNEDQPSQSALEASSPASDVSDNDMMSFVLAEIPLTCLFVYWSLLIESIVPKDDKISVSKLKTLINNCLHVFCAVEKCSDEDECKNDNDGNDDNLDKNDNDGNETTEADDNEQMSESIVADLKNTTSSSSSSFLDRIELIPFNFQPVAPERIDRFVHLLSLKDFADTLSARINCIYEKDKRIQLEENFKTCAKKQRNCTRINLTLVIRKWLDMFVYRHCNKFFCGGDEVSRQEIEHYMTISTMMVSCTSMFIIGLGQIWFFNEYASLQKNNDKNNAHALEMINKNSSKFFLVFFFFQRSKF